MVLVVQLEPQTEGLNAKLVEIFSPRIPLGDPLKLKVPHGCVGFPHPTINITLASNGKSFRMVPAFVKLIRVTKVMVRAFRSHASGGTRTRVAVSRPDGSEANVLPGARASSQCVHR